MRLSTIPSTTDTLKTMGWGSTKTMHGPSVLKPGDHLPLLRFKHTRKRGWSPDLSTHDHAYGLLSPQVFGEYGEGVDTVKQCLEANGFRSRGFGHRIGHPENPRFQGRGLGIQVVRVYVATRMPGPPPKSPKCRWLASIYRCAHLFLGGRIYL